MVKALVVYCHPRPESFTAAVRDVVLARLDQHGAETRLIDLYALGFDPVLPVQTLRDYADKARNTHGMEQSVADLLWCDTLIFVYPTWWYGMPAMLKGWLDRVLLPGVAFMMPEGAGGAIRPGLTRIRRLAVFTTCGASRWISLLMGVPGHRALTRGVRLLCAKPCRTVFAALYSLDSSTPKSRAAHLARVGAKVDRLILRADVV
jgi:putative NADPH-quinone reductase